MACGSVCGDSNVPVLIQSKDSLWFPSSSSFQGQEKMVTIDNVNGGDNMETPIFQSLIKEENAEDDSEICFASPRKKRRLTAAQVQFLERSFEVENKLEPERKVQLAKEVGLHPRQVAVWFQNRRARYKTKQLEKDYDSLKASYDKLKSDYDRLLEEKNSLQNEVNALKRKLSEKDKSIADLEPAKPMNSMKAERQDLSRDMEAIVTKSPMLIVPKQEDASCSAKSDVFDSDSPQHSYLELADSSRVFETDQYQSDFSQDEDDKVDLSRSFFAKLYEEPAANSCSFEFPVEDQPFWSWSY